MIGSSFFPFLPSQLTSASEGQITSDALSVYKTDFITSKPRLNGKSIAVNRDKDPTTNHEKGFWHIISHDPNRMGVRVFDMERAIRIPWTRPSIENNSAIGVAEWRYLEGNQSIRCYIYLDALKYVVILEEKPGYYLLVTAFYVDAPWKQKNLDKKLKNKIT